MPLPSIRTDLRSGDIGEITRLHGVLYRAEYGWDERFEAYVAEGLAQFVLNEASDRGCIWIAEQDARIVGCIAIVKVTEAEAQLRWFLVVPEMRGTGLGRKLIEDAMTFCRNQGFQRVFLWTVSDLTAAAHLYRSCGFERTESKTHEVWGQILTEERYDTIISPAPY